MRRSGPPNLQPRRTVPVELTLDRISEEDALAVVISSLRNPPRADPMSRPTYGYDLYIPAVVGDQLRAQREARRAENVGHMTSYSYNTDTNAAPFYSAAWNLCLRGILSPGIVRPQMTGVIIGGGFNLTTYGRTWLDGISGFECVPSEYGRFAAILASHSQRFGHGYHSRAQEAARCYQAHAYYACCAMCGAAAESIILALAIEKTGDEDRVHREYNTMGGRGKVERLLTGQMRDHLKQWLTNYMDLLKYWRDSAAHGVTLAVGEEEAFTSLMLLLRLAQFGDAHWADLTARPNSRS